MAGRKKFWASMLIALPLAQVAASFLMKRGTPLTIVSDVVQGLLLVVSCFVIVVNLIVNTTLNWLYRTDDGIGA